jgi:hypothetical protein
MRRIPSRHPARMRVSLVLDRYPGARCESDSYIYCCKSGSGPWSERYPDQPEILRYFKYVAKRHDLKRDCSSTRARPEAVSASAKQSGASRLHQATDGKVTAYLTELHNGGCRALTELNEAAGHCLTVQDLVTRDLFEELMRKEERHVDYLETQLDLIARLGVELYSSITSATQKLALQPDRPC